MDNDYRVLDAFSGAGGFSLGFEMAGAHLVGAIEQDKWASETFQFNHPNAVVLKADIKDLSDQELLDTFGPGRPNVILGGPPCQGYSISNRNNGDPKDPRNSLFTEFIRLGSLFGPDLMIMENVPNLIKAKTTEKSKVIDIIISELEQLGYFVYHTILNATDFGVPQIRKRLFVVASKIELETAFPMPSHSMNNTADLFGGELAACPTLWDAISDLPQLNAREGAEELDYDAVAKNDFQLELRGLSPKLFNHKAMNHSKRLVDRFASMSWGQSTSDVPDHLRPRKRNSSELAETVYDQNNRRMHPDKPCHTIAASFYANFVHPYCDRNFTSREGARIQTFPDAFVFKGKPTVVSHKLLQREGRSDEKFLCQYNQIGNAVPPFLAKAVARNLFDQMRSWSENDVCIREQLGAERKSQNQVYG